MSARAVAWPTLPAVDALLVDEPDWAYPGVNAVGGLAHLRVWSTGGGPRLAVVTDRDVGCSVTNAAEHIHAALVEQHGVDVVRLEHYPPRQHDEPHVLDQVVVDDRGAPQWRRVWPTPIMNPRYVEFLEWTCHGGAAVLAALTSGGAR